MTSGMSRTLIRLGLATEGADVDTSTHTMLETAPAPLASPPLVQPEKRTPARPELNRQERLISAAYLLMIALIGVFLAVTGLLAALGV
jgi:hypothetical protein